MTGDSSEGRGLGIDLGFRRSIQDRAGKLSPQAMSRWRL